MTIFSTVGSGRGLALECCKCFCNANEKCAGIYKDMATPNGSIHVEMLQLGDQAITIGETL